MYYWIKFMIVENSSVHCPHFPLILESFPSSRSNHVTFLVLPLHTYNSIWSIKKKPYLSIETSLLIKYVKMLFPFEQTHYKNRFDLTDLVFRSNFLENKKLDIWALFFTGPKLLLNLKFLWKRMERIILINQWHKSNHLLKGWGVLLLVQEFCDRLSEGVS